MEPRFQGVYPVVLTPLQDDSGVDEEALGQSIRYLIENGVHGLVILGSNGESPYLTDRERRQVIDVALEANEGRVPVVVGTSYMGTDQTCELGRYAREAGAHGLLSALPIFYPLEEDDVFRHYETVSERVSLPILYYHFPMATHLALTPEQIRRLASIPNLAGLKASVADVDEVEEIVERTREKPFSVFTGTCMNFYLTLQRGVQGVICPIVNLLPGTIVSLWDAFHKGEDDRALDIQLSFSEIAILFSSTPTPHALMKEAMRRLGHGMNPHVKGPLPPLTDEQARFVEETLRSAGEAGP